MISLMSTRAYSLPRNARSRLGSAQPLAVLLALGILMGTSSCNGVNVEAEATSPIGSAATRITTPGGQPEPIPYPASFVRIVPAGEMVGLCVAACNDTQCGAPVELHPGPNEVPTPAGTGTIYLVFYPCGSDAAPNVLGDSSSQRAFHFAQGPWVPSPTSENLHFYLRIRAASLDHAQSRRRVLAEMHQRLLDGFDPGPLPAWAEFVSFTSWRLMPGGGIRMTSIKPGTRVTSYELSWGGAPGATRLGEGAVAWILGDWQVVQADIEPQYVELPNGDEPVVHTYELEFGTDLEDAQPDAATISLEPLE